MLQSPKLGKKHKWPENAPAPFLKCTHNWTSDIYIYIYSFGVFLPSFSFHLLILLRLAPYWVDFWSDHYISLNLKTQYEIIPTCHYFLCLSSWPYTSRVYLWVNWLSHSIFLFTGLGTVDSWCHGRRCLEVPSISMKEVYFYQRAQMHSPQAG